MRAQRRQASRQRKMLARIADWHRGLRAKVRRHPILVLVQLPLHMLLLAAVTAALVLAWSLGEWLAPAAFNPQREFLARGAFFLLLAATMAHLFYLSSLAFFATARLGRRGSAAATIMEMLFTLMFGFAVIYYYLQLLSGNTALEGMHPIPGVEARHKIAFGLRLLLLPPFEVVIDCLYFSTATIATVGYGDIHAVSPLARIFTTLEMAAGFLLITVSLGSILGSKE